MRGVFSMWKSQKVLLLAFMVVLCASSRAQQVKHAPTTEQCRADQRLWLDKIEDSGEMQDFETLDGWFLEMFECKSVDPDNVRLYHNVLSEVAATQVLRLERFLQRHDLYDRFIAEDRAGKR
jgi:hypothetical protein